MLVAAKCPNAPFVETGFAKQLTLFATFQEGLCLKQCHNVVKYCKMEEKNPQNKQISSCLYDKNTSQGWLYFQFFFPGEKDLLGCKEN